MQEKQAKWKMDKRNIEIRQWKHCYNIIMKKKKKLENSNGDIFLEQYVQEKNTKIKKK